MKLTLLLIPLIFLSSCSIDWNDEKDAKIAELEKQVQELKKLTDELNKEKLELLIGKYFTPDFAPRRIEFFMNGRFQFSEDENLMKEGTYKLNGDKLLLTFEQGETQQLSFHKGNDLDNNFYIEGDGEYFVKE